METEPSAAHPRRTHRSGSMREELCTAPQFLCGVWPVLLEPLPLGEPVELFRDLLPLAPQVEVLQFQAVG